MESGVNATVNPELYESRLFFSETLASRASESEYFQASCGYTKRIVTTVEGWAVDFDLEGPLPFQTKAKDLLNLNRPPNNHRLF
jgi:hypothetical protein